MADNEIVVDPQEFIRDHYVLIANVRYIQRPFVKLRLRMALYLCRLAARVGGIGLKINEEVGVIVEDKGIVKHG